MAKRVMALTALIAAVLAIPVSGTRYSFVPDWTFKGSTLTGWHTVGQADWKAANGELVGTPKSPDGGWLLLDKSFQDVQVGFDFKCDRRRQDGRAAARGENAGGDEGRLRVAQRGRAGRVRRDARCERQGIDARAASARRRADARRADGGRSGRHGGGARSARGRRGHAAGASGGGRPAGLRRRCTGRGAGGPGARRGRGVLPSGTELANLAEPTAFKPNDWNDLDVVIDANILRPWVNKGGGNAAGTGGAADEELGSVRPDRAVRRRHGRSALPGRVVSRSQRQARRARNSCRPTSDAAADAVLLLVRVGRRRLRSRRQHGHRLGAVHLLRARLHEEARDSTWRSPRSPACRSRPTGSSSPATSPATAGRTCCSRRPRARSSTSIRRASRGAGMRIANVIPPGPSVAEVSVMKDIDGDGKPDLVYMGGGALRWAKPDPANPTGHGSRRRSASRALTSRTASAPATSTATASVDILNAYGWWEQPGKADTPMWTYHPAGVRPLNGRGAPGGAEMCVYDVNGDGLNDVVTSLQAHGFGLAWFEQKRDAAGNDLVRAAHDLGRLRRRRTPAT